jgi:outer membrane receptor for ferrienterochelin and colicin
MTGDSGAEHHRRTRVVLTTKIKRAICEALGACEYCGAAHPPEELEILQIGMLSGNPDRPYENPANALIVLCREHYQQAKEGTLRKNDLKTKVTKRSDKKKKAIRGQLQKLDRTYDGSNVDKYRNPVVFGVGAFMKDRPGHHR